MSPKKLLQQPWFWLLPAMVVPLLLVSSATGAMDPILARACAHAMPEGTGRNWEGVTKLQLGIGGLERLNGIQRCANLREAQLGNKLSPGLSRTSLQRSLGSVLFIRGPQNTYRDLTPLAGLSQLETLNLEASLWREPQYRFRYPWLVSVSFRFPRFLQDASWLSETVTERPYDPHSQLLVLQQLTTLRRLNLAGNNLEQIAPLSALTQLEELDLTANPIEDIGPLATLSNLRVLHLNGTRVNDLSPLAELRQLEAVDLANSFVTDLGPLLFLPNLKVVKLDDGDWNRKPFYKDGTDLMRDVQRLRDRGVRVLAWPDSILRNREDWADPNAPLMHPGIRERLGGLSPEVREKVAQEIAEKLEAGPDA